MRFLVQVVLGAEVVRELDGSITFIHNDSLLFIATEVDVDEEQWLLLIILGILAIFFWLLLLFNGLLSLHSFLALRRHCIIIEGLLSIISNITSCWLLQYSALGLLLNRVIEVIGAWLIIKHVSLIIRLVQSKIIRHVVHFLLKLFS